MALAFREMVVLADVKHQASTDELTDLPNRRMFMRRLERALEAGRLTGVTVSVLMLDLNNFKQLNDTLGHDAGDELLRLIGPRLSACLTSADTVARLGGDEFAILIDRPVSADTLAAELLGCVRAPFLVQGLALRLTASLGIASFPEHATDPRELLKRADVAMYLAKASRRGWEIYAPERDTNSREALLLANDLASALERGGIVAHFQPIADAASREVVGAEALVRWRRPDGSLIPPHEFISAAEHAGLSRPLTRRMLMLALEQVAGWRGAGHELYVAINATVADLLDANFPDEIAAALDLHGVPPSALVVEVTESSILADPDRIELVLAGLRAVGVGLALDDFGTGYSSLAHLRTLTVDQVKIDRSFVRTMCAERADAAIVQATVGLAHQLGLRVVAEGVEDEQTWQALAELGCERVQGYVLGRPMAPAEFQRLIGPARAAVEA
jgi:diguanylate cyclase (GGDEF)-like protein